MDVKSIPQIKPTISVVTATFNAEQYLPALIKSLQAQTDKDFEWVIADGGSTDSTLSLLAEVKDLNINITSQADFGIYDALNRGVKKATGEYYIVIGADDVFYSNAIGDLKKAINTSVDILSANIIQNDYVVSPLNKAPWLYGMRTYVSSHSVGTLFKKSLHDKFGYYSNKFPITADNLFILKVMADKRIGLKQIDTVIGEFSDAGLSGTDTLGALVENFRVQVIMGSNKYLQIACLFLRLLKNSLRY